MSIAPTPLPDVVEQELAKYSNTIDLLHAGAIDADKVFRPFRLVHGVYGQRQGGENQMVRIKLKYGVVTPIQMRALAPTASATSPPARRSSSTTCRSMRPPRCCASWRTSA